MTVRNALAGVAVSHFTSSVDWYTSLFGRGPDTLPMNGLAEWEFDNGGWIQVFEDNQRAGSSSVTLVETDVRALIKDLEGKNVEIVSQTDTDTIKLAIIKDPDGNQVVFAEGKGEKHKAASTELGEPEFGRRPFPDAM